MNLRQSLKSQSQAAILMQPGEGALYHPPRLAQTTAMPHKASGQHWLDTPSDQQTPVRVRIIATVCLHPGGSEFRPARPALDRRNSLYKWQQLGDIVHVGGGQNDGKWRAFCIRDRVMLAPRFSSIRRARPRFFPPWTARTNELSTRARSQSILSWPRSSASSASWSCCQTPASCHSRSRRQQLTPEPQFISCGRYAQGIPVFNTYRMPVNTCRSDRRLRPGWRNRLSLTGRSGSIRSHNASSNIGLAINTPCFKGYSSLITPDRFVHFEIPS